MAQIMKMMIFTLITSYFWYHNKWKVFLTGLHTVVITKGILSGAWTFNHQAWENIGFALQLHFLLELLTNSGPAENKDHCQWATPLFGLYGDVLLDWVWLFGLAALNWSFVQSKKNVEKSKQRQGLLTREECKCLLHGIIVILLPDPFHPFQNITWKKINFVWVKWFSCSILTH